MDRYSSGFNEKHDQEFLIGSMRKYVKEKQEMDKQLEKIISPYIKNNNSRILDACCGIGHISYFLSDLSPNSTFLGIDQSSFLIEDGKKLCADKKNIVLEVGDIYDLPKKYSKYFDVTISWKTISWIPYYDKFLKALFSMTKDHIFLNSLFYEGDIDFITKVFEYKKEYVKSGNFLYYNVYGLSRFKEFVYGLGAKNIEVYDFEIPFDIPKPPIDQMGTYTEKLVDGRRLQISGSMIMPWKTIRIDL